MALVLADRARAWYSEAPVGECPGRGWVLMTLMSPWLLGRRLLCLLSHHGRDAPFGQQPSKINNQEHRG